METIRIPLLKDHHNHPSLYSALSQCIDLRDIPTRSQALKRIRHEDTHFCFVMGWNNSCYSFTRQELDQLPPVFILSSSLHTLVMNDSGRKILSETHPAIAAHSTDASWVERNLPQILKMIVELKGCDPAQLANFYGQLRSRGIWYAEEMLLPSAEIFEVYRAAHLLGRTACWVDPETWSTLSADQQDEVRGIKLFADGALGARTAALSQPYSDGQRGLLIRSSSAFGECLTEIVRWKKPIAIHAIGDLAIQTVLDNIEDLQSGSGQFPEVRLEHCQFIDRRNADRAREFGVTLSMQPNFSGDSVVYRDRLSADQAVRNNPFRMLIDEAGFEPGINLLLGSDGMPHGILAALSSSLFPPLPSQTLSLDEFVAGYCLDDFSEGNIDVRIDWKSKQISIGNPTDGNSPILS